MSHRDEFHPPSRILLGPGPSPVEPRVLHALSGPMVGHLDPIFLKCMDDIQEMLRQVFETTNRVTFPVSGTGSAGMETALVNLLEPGDEVIVAINGVFSERMFDIAGRCGAVVHPLRLEWGSPVRGTDISQALAQHPQTKVVCVVHAETSTGALTPLDEIQQAVKASDVLTLVDSVASLGAHRIEVDRRGIDICYAGSQKALSCPPGLAPITFSERAIAKIRARKQKVQSWYFDVSMIEQYWGADRTYHHTAPISLNYALREALRIVLEEGLDNRARRHERNQQALIAGLEALGLKVPVSPEFRSWTLTTVRIPDGIDDLGIRRRLINEFNIEISGGLGPFKGKIWRIGLMGAGSKRGNVLLLLAALENILRDAGFQPAGSGVAAAHQIYGA